MRWLINTLPTPVLGILIVGGLVLFAVAGLAIVHRYLPHIQTGEHNDVAGFLLGVIAAMYGILLAYVIVAVYAEFSDAEVTVRNEATAISELVHDTQSMPIAGEMQATLRSYVHTTVERDWPLMRNGEISEESGQDLDHVFAILQSYDPQTTGPAAFYQEAISDLNTINASRRDRAFEAEDELPPMLQALIIGGAVLLAAFTWLFGMKRFRTQLAMVAGVSALVGAGVFVCLVVDLPFSGDLTVSTAPFHEGALAAFWP